MPRILIGLAFLLFTGSAALACEERLIEGEGIVKSPVCVPSSAERIVVLDPTYSLGMSLELDLPVVGAPLFGMSDEILKEKALAEGVTDIGAFTEPSIEKVVALQPDLIIGSGLLAPVYDIASQIAPTVLISDENWRDYYARVGEIAGKSADVERLLADLDERVAGVRARVVDKTVSIVRITPWDFQVYLDAPDAYGPFAVLRDAGVKRTDYETSTDETTLKRPDWEDIAELDGDILLYIVGGSNDSAESGRHEEVIENPLWKMLPAVRSGNVHRVDAATWMEFSGVTSANRVLDDVERYIADQ